MFRMVYLTTYLSLNQQEIEDFLNVKVLVVGSDEGEINIEEFVNSGPVVVNFITGTWCPMCLVHLRAILSASKASNLKVLIVSSESQLKLENEFEKSSSWRELDSIPFAICSDSGRKLINIFKLKVPLFGFSKPATFLFQSKDSIQVLSSGVPNKEKTICELSYYATKVS